MHVPRPQLGHIYHRHWSRCSDGNDQPDQRGESEARKRPDLQPEGVAWLKIADRGKGQQEHGRRSGRQHNQGNVNDAVQSLAAAAVLAGREMQLVVPAHFWSEPGDVIPPSRKDFPHDRFDALCHRRFRPRLQPDGSHGFRLGSQQDTITPQPLTAAQSLFR
jgi:hypothetical protein